MCPTRSLFASSNRASVPTDLKAIDDPLSFRVIDDRDREINVLGEPRLRAERHREPADDGPPSANGIKVGSRLPENLIDGLHLAYPRADNRRRSPISPLGRRSHACT